MTQASISGDIPIDGVMAGVLDALREMTGLCLFRVSGTWAHCGRTGEFTDIVAALDAISAVRRAWDVEDPRDLRTVLVEWLCPVESVKNAREDSPSVAACPGNAETPFRPTMTVEGYPGDESLAKITAWPFADHAGLFEFVQKIWEPQGSFTKYENEFQEPRVKLVTGGWSGNESIIGALQANFVFWSMRWERSESGGVYVFEYPQSEAGA